jgi:hypothetical protein
MYEQHGRGAWVAPLYHTHFQSRSQSGEGDAVSGVTGRKHLAGSQKPAL